MNQGEPRQPIQPARQTEVVPEAPANPPPGIGDDQWNKDVASILTSNTNDALAELGFNSNVLRAFKEANNTIVKLRTEKKALEIKNQDLSAHLALANSRIDFSKQDHHAMWQDVTFQRERYQVLERQYQGVLRAHSACATGSPGQSYAHLLQDLEKLQDMYRYILGQNTTLKFEVQRLMQRCVNAGLIPPPQNYIVTPIPALQPPGVQSGPARRVSEPTVGLQHQLQVPAQCSKKAAQPGLVSRQFTSPPPDGYPTNTSGASNPAIVAGPIQAYNYHRAQFPQPQQSATQIMPPLQLQGQSSTAATLPRQVIDLTTGDERVPKRPRLSSDSNVYIQNPPGLVTQPQHRVYAQMPAPAYQILQQRNPQPRAQLSHMSNVQTQPTQQYHSQRLGPTNSYQQISPPASFAQYRTNTPAPPVSATLVMDGYGAVTGGQGTTTIQGQIQAISQPRQMYPDPTYSANAASPIAEAGGYRSESLVERPTGTPPGSTPAAGPPDLLPVSPRVTTSGRTHGGESPLPSLTEEQTRQMRSEVADSMFTEPQKDDRTEARTCVLCLNRREKDILPVSPQPLLKPTTEELYSHLYTQHPESLELGERDWKMELFGMGPFMDQ